MQHNPYSQSLEARVLAATPLELVVILYDEAINTVRAARAHLAAGNIRERSRAVSKAIAILIELTGSLNFEAGGELSQRLAGLYGFMRTSLTEANVRQTDEGLANTERLLMSLREAWSEVSAQPAGSAAHPAPTDLAAGFPWGVAQETGPVSRTWSA